MPVIALFLAFQSLVQNTFKTVVRDSETKEPLTGATVLVRGTATGSVTDVNGFTQIQNIPDGKCTIVITFVG